MYTMHYDHSHKTAVPTELLQDPYLSVDTKGLAAILCSFGKDTFELSELAAAVNRIASNINQICRRINNTGHFYEADVAELKDRLGDVWELLKARQKEEL